MVTVPPIRRSEALARAKNNHAPNSLEYSMTALCSHGFRRDCSGQVCEWLDVPLELSVWGGLSTVTMLSDADQQEPGVQALFYRIAARDLLPGDIVGILGPGTGGSDGHVRLFAGWFNDVDSDNRYWSYEQGFGSHGPDNIVHDDLAEAGHGLYRAYRYIGIVDDPVTPGGYTVVRGDTLAAIASRFGWSSWETLYDRNRSTVGSNPSLIHPGMVLDVSNPPAKVRRTYTVKSGDTLTRIGLKYSRTVAQLASWNRIANPNLIRPGQILFVDPK